MDKIEQTDQPPTLDMDDGEGLRVIHAEAQSESRFSWDLFRDFGRLRILTYSASVQAVLRLIEDDWYDQVECIFGYEGTLGNFKEVIGYQMLVVDDLRGGIRNVDASRAAIMERVAEGRVVFRVLEKGISHAKVYLLDQGKGSTKYRVLVGSANLSEAAFGGRQTETLQCFSNDALAWEKYCVLYDKVRNDSSLRIDLGNVDQSVSIIDAPSMKSNNETRVFVDTGKRDPKATDLVVMNTPEQRIRDFETMVESLPREVTNAIPSAKRGVQTISPEAKRKIQRASTHIKQVDDGSESTARQFSVDRVKRTATLNRDEFKLESDPDKVRSDALLMIKYFQNFELGFKGGHGVERLQRDYFVLWSWMYFSPFICDVRSNADDVFRFPFFAIVYGKPSCGKSSLIDTVITSMFGKPYSYDKRELTRTGLYRIMDNCKRFPAVFDDIGRSAFREHAQDVIKDENSPRNLEYPPFVLSMNQDLNAFTDDVVKRCLMVYTTTALPAYDEELRHHLLLQIKDIRENLTGDLYRAFVSRVVDSDHEAFYGPDWLEFASGILVELIDNASQGAIPDWCRVATWSEYASKRHDRVKGQLTHLLRDATRMKREGDQPTGWFPEDKQIVVIERTDTFGRREFDWNSVPSTLINEEATVGGRTVLHRATVEEFIGQPIGRSGNSLWNRLTGR